MHYETINNKINLYSNLIGCDDIYNYNDFLKNLKKIRLEKKLTQKELAQHLGIDRSTYANYEAGKRKLDSETMLKISNYLNVNLDYLLGKDTFKSLEFKDLNLKLNDVGAWLEYDDLQNQHNIILTNLINMNLSIDDYLNNDTLHPEIIACIYLSDEELRKLNDSLNDFLKFKLLSLKDDPNVNFIILSDLKE